MDDFMVGLSVFSCGGEQKRTGGLFMGVMIFYMIVLLCILGKVEVENRAVVVGSICVVIGSFMYSSPMTVIVRFNFFEIVY
jgi:hypothetical protein